MGTLGLWSCLYIAEMLTIKSDDIVGRSAAFDAIVRGEKISHPHTSNLQCVVESITRSGLRCEVGKRRIAAT